MKRTEIKIVALDLDGTVFNDQKEITKRTRAAIQQAIEKGVMVMPATGRAVTGLPEAFLTIPGVRYALTSNGARVVDLLDENRVIYEDCMDAELVLPVVEQSLGYACNVDVYINGVGYCQNDRLREVERYVRTKVMQEYVRNTRVGVENLTAFVQENKPSSEKVNLSFEKLEERLIAWQSFGQNPRLTVTSSLENNLEINSDTANKGTGLVEFARTLGFGREAIMACGDGGNDLKMLQMAGFSVAMANGSDAVKAAADCITLSNEEEGVAYAIEKFIL